MSQDFKKIIYLVISLLVPLEMIPPYPDIDISHWLVEDFHWIIDKVFRDKLRV